MGEPLLYISYGMAKSGSTLGFRLVSAVLEEAGAPQADVDVGPAGGADASTRFVEVIRPRELKALRRIAEARTRRPISIKTHSGLWDCVRRGLEDGWIIGHAVCRDPRDIALSIMDASRRDDAWGRRDGQPLRHIEDALDYVRAHAEKFEKWAAAPGVLVLPYERLAFDTEAMAAEVAAQIRVDVDAKRCARIAHASGTNRNKGRSRRHLTELRPELSAKIAEEFAEFIERWCAPDFVPPKRGLFSRLVGG